MFEYKVFKDQDLSKPNEIEQVLNNLGEKGWELVSIDPTFNNGYMMVLKREKNQFVG